MCVSISNVTVVAQVSGGRQLVHASVNNLSLDGSILPRSQIALCILVDAFSARLLQTVTAGTNERYRSSNSLSLHCHEHFFTPCSDQSASESLEVRMPNKSWQPCLAEFSVGFQTEIHVDPVKPIIQVKVSLLGARIISQLFLFFPFTETDPEHYQSKSNSQRSLFQQKVIPRRRNDGQQKPSKVPDSAIIHFLSSGKIACLNIIRQCFLN